MLAIYLYKLVYRYFFQNFFHLYIKTCILNHLIQYIEWFVLVLTQATMHSSVMKTSSKISILQQVSMSLPLNHILYIEPLFLKILKGSLLLNLRWFFSTLSKTNERKLFISFSGVK